MAFKFMLIYLVLLFCNIIYGQDNASLFGTWKGWFEKDTFGIFEFNKDGSFNTKGYEDYKFEGSSKGKYLFKNNVLVLVAKQKSNKSDKWEKVDFRESYKTEFNSENEMTWTQINQNGKLSEKSIVMRRINNYEEIIKKIEGKWFKIGVTEFNCGSALDIKLGQTIHNFCVESNQIFLEVSYIYHQDENKLKLHYHRTEDLGAGGARLPWNLFDKDSPLAEIDLTNFDGDKFTLEWLGFKNKKDIDKKYDFGFDYDGEYYLRKSENNKIFNNTTLYVPMMVLNHVAELHKNYSTYKKIHFIKCQKRLDLNNDDINEFIFWIVGSPETKGRGNLVIYEGEKMMPICEMSGLYEVTGSESIRVLAEKIGGYNSFVIGDKNKLKFSFDKKKKTYLYSIN